MVIDSYIFLTTVIYFPLILRCYNPETGVKFLLEEGVTIMMRFDRFTERAQEAAQRSAEIIQRYGHNQIDTEHILLALIEQPDGVITQILETLNVDAAALTERLDYILRTSPKANIFGGGAGQIFITPAGQAHISTWRMKKPIV